MNKLLFVNLLICVIVSINCVKLINICSKDHFTHKNVVVNSFHIIKHNISFSKVANFEIDQNIEYDTYFNENSKIKKMLELRKMYNDKMTEIYNDKYINNPKSFDNILNDQQNLFNIYKDIYQLSTYVLTNYRYSFKVNTLVKVEMGLAFAKTLVWTKLNKFDQNTKRIEEIENLLESMDIDDTQLIALKDDSMEIIYHDHEIVKLDKFDFYRFSKIFYDLRSHGDLILNYLIPFHNLKFNRIDNCVYAEQLPKFYQNRTLLN